MMNCLWCEAEGAKIEKNTVYWELPDGTRSIEITETPCVKCENCLMEYQEEDVITNIEDQLLLIDTNKIDDSISFQHLMKQPRLLKRNYFNF